MGGVGSRGWKFAELKFAKSMPRGAELPRVLGFNSAARHHQTRRTQHSSTRLPSTTKPWTV